jgi:tellurite resistance protein TehA-like permease
MTFAAAIFLIAAGAILRYAVTAHSDVINLDTLGLILMIVGFAGLILAFVQELIWTDRVDRARRPPPEDPRYPPR